MPNDFEARKKMFKGMGEFAQGERSNELRSKYGPKEPAPDVEHVPGTDETDDGGDMPPGDGPPLELGGDAMGGDPMGADGAPPEIEAILAKLTPEEQDAILSMME